MGNDDETRIKTFKINLEGNLNSIKGGHANFIEYALRDMDYLKFDDQTKKETIAAALREGVSTIVNRSLQRSDSRELMAFEVTDLRNCLFAAKEYGVPIPRVEELAVRGLIDRKYAPENSVRQEPEEDVFSTAPKVDIDNERGSKQGNLEEKVFTPDQPTMSEDDVNRHLLTLRSGNFLHFQNAVNVLLEYGEKNPVDIHSAFSEGLNRGIEQYLIYHKTDGLNDNERAGLDYAISVAQNSNIKIPHYEELLSRRLIGDQSNRQSELEEQVSESEESTKNFNEPDVRATEENYEQSPYEIPDDAGEPVTYRPQPRAARRKLEIRKKIGKALESVTNKLAVKYMQSRIRNEMNARVKARAKYKADFGQDYIEASATDEQKEVFEFLLNDEKKFRPLRTLEEKSGRAWPYVKTLGQLALTSSLAYGMKYLCPDSVDPFINAGKLLGQCHILNSNLKEKGLEKVVSYFGQVALCTTGIPEVLGGMSKSLESVLSQTYNDEVISFLTPLAYHAIGGWDNIKKGIGAGWKGTKFVVGEGYDYTKAIVKGIGKGIGATAKWAWGNQEINTLTRMGAILGTAYCLSDINGDAPIDSVNHYIQKGVQLVGTNIDSARKLADDICSDVQRAHDSVTGISSMLRNALGVAVPVVGGKYLFKPESKLAKYLTMAAPFMYLGYKYGPALEKIFHSAQKGYLQTAGVALGALVPYLASEGYKKYFTAPAQPAQQNGQRNH